MILTARQLQDLQARSSEKDQIVLPYGARLSPLAIDWARSKRIKIGYGPTELTAAKHPAPGEPVPTAAPLGVKTLLWWCDGPCGAAKAAIAAQSRESNLAAIELPSETKQLTAVIRKLATEIKAGRAGGGVL